MQFQLFYDLFPSKSINLALSKACLIQRKLQKWNLFKNKENWSQNSIQMHSLILNRQFQRIILIFHDQVAFYNLYHLFIIIFLLFLYSMIEMMAQIILFLFFYNTEQLPQIQYESQFNTYSYPAYPSDTCMQMQLTNNYIFRLGSNNVVMMVDKATLTNKANLLNYTYTTLLEAQVSSNFIKNFNVDQNQTFITLSQATQSAILFLPNFTMKMFTLASPFYKTLLDLKNLVFSAFMQTPYSNDQYLRFTLPSLSTLSLSSNITFTLTSYPLQHIKNCQCAQSPNSRYLVYWDQFSNVFVYNYTNTSMPPSYLGTLSSNLTTANLTQSISFSRNGDFFLLEADALLPVTIVSLSPASFLSTRSFSFNGTINKAMFLDSSASLVILFNDSAYTLVSAAALNILDTVALSVSTSVIDIDYSQGKIYLCKNSTVEVYKTFYPAKSCSLNCAACNSPSECLICDASYTLINAFCFANLKNSTSQNPSTNTSNPTPTPTNNLSSNTTSPSNVPSPTFSSSNNTAQNCMYLVMPNGQIIFFQISYSQALVINSTQQAIKYTNIVLQKLMFFLTSSPFLFVFLGNIQIFTISSLYFILNVPIPIDIKQSLMSAATSLNANIFSMLNIKFDVPSLGVQRVSDKNAVSYGASSLFLPNNYQFFIISSAVIAFIYLLYFIIRKCKATFTLFYYLINNNKEMVVFGICVSSFIPIMLPFISICQQPQSINFYDKINQAINFFTIGCIIAFAGIFPSSIGFVRKLSVKNIKKVTFEKTIAYDKEVGSLINLKKQRINIYLVLLNVVFPLLVVVEQPIYFLFVGLILLLFGLAKVFCCTVSNRTNKIILNIYPIAFHLCFAIFYFSSSSNVIVIAEITALLIYFIGSLHELITIFYDFIAFVYRVIKANCKNRGKIKPSEVEQTQYQNLKLSDKISTRMIRSKNRRQNISKSKFKGKDHSLDKHSESKAASKLKKNEVMTPKMIERQPQVPPYEKTIRIRRGRPVIFTIKKEQNI